MKKINDLIKYIFKRKKKYKENTKKNFTENYFSTIIEKVEKDNKKFTFSDYEILKQIKKTKNSKKYLVKNKITKKTTKLEIYNKKTLYLNKKIKKLKTRLKFSKKFGISPLRIFQDKINIYIEKENNIAYNLQDLIKTKIHIKEEEIKNITISILKNLSKIHRKNYLYLNLHPKNIIFDKFGKLFLQKFDYIQKKQNAHNSQKRQKRLIYLPPEIYNSKNLDHTSDFYSLGVILYKIFLGENFYNEFNFYQYEKIIFKEEKLLIKKFQIPEGWSLESADFVNRLLQFEPLDRLGVLQENEVFEHPWVLGGVEGFAGREGVSGREGWGEWREDCADGVGFQEDLEFLEFDFI